MNVKFIYIVCIVNKVKKIYFYFLRKRELVQVPIHLTDDIERLAGIVNGTEKEIVKGEVEDTGVHWNVRESGREKGTGYGREREEECLRHQ
jgi:hypothetical protein